jgi:hypothetical protein
MKRMVQAGGKSKGAKALYSSAVPTSQTEAVRCAFAEEVAERLDGESIRSCLAHADIRRNRFAIVDDWQDGRINCVEIVTER